VGKKSKRKRRSPAPEGDRREASGAGREHEPSPPGPKRRYRRHAAEYKLAIVLAADSLLERGQVSALLRREELTHSQLSEWRRELREGKLGPATAQQKGMRSPLVEVEVRQLKRKTERLEAKLRQAELIIQLQKKASEILGVDLPDDDDIY